MLGHIFASVGDGSMDDFERKKYMFLIMILAIAMGMGVVLLAYDALSALLMR